MFGIIFQRDSSDPFNLSELIDELSRKQKEELWEQLRSLLTDVLLESPVHSWQSVEPKDEDSVNTKHDSKMVVLVSVSGTAVSFLC